MDTNNKQDEPGDEENQNLHGGGRGGGREVVVLQVAMPDNDDDRSARRRPKRRSFLPDASENASYHGDGLYASEHSAREPIVPVDLDPTQTSQSHDEEQAAAPSDIIGSSCLTHSSSSPAIVAPRRPSITRESAHCTATFDALRRSLHSNGDLRRTNAMSRATSMGSASSALSRQTAGVTTEDDASARLPEIDEDDAEDPHSRAFRAAIMSACHNAFGIIGADVWREYASIYDLFLSRYIWPCVIA